MGARKLPRPEVPLSESIIPKIPEATFEEVVADLRELAQANPEKVISRNWYRVNGKYAESAWSRYFGTFSEFKRQSGIVLSRQQHHLEKQIAKHASVDHYRTLSAERAEWGEKYLREDSKRWQLGMFCSDLHDEEIDPFFLRVWLDTVKRCQPDKVSFVGDVMDMPEFGKYTVDPRSWNPAKRLTFALEQIFRPTRKAAPDAQIDVIEGNHERRVLLMLADSTPALKVVLSEFHGMTMQKFFKLDELEINWVGKGDLAAYTNTDIQKELRNNYRIYWDSFLAHHFPQGKDMGMPGCNGHNHKHNVWPMFNHNFGAYEWHQMGAGHRRSAEYCEGEKWHNGFLINHVDTHTKAQVQEYIQITDIASVGGKLYVRQPDEQVNLPLLKAA